jgi:antitoxin VapB
MPTTRIFKSGNSQAVRIPADLAYSDPAQELTITRLGDVITLAPPRRSLRDAVADLRAMPNPPDVELVERIEVRDRAID